MIGIERETVAIEAFGLRQPPRAMMRDRKIEQMIGRCARAVRHPSLERHRRFAGLFDS